MIEDPRNTVLITSAMASHALGRRLVEGVKEVRILGESHKVHAKAATINGLSTHAGQELILAYASKVKQNWKGILLVHAAEKNQPQR